MLSNSSVSSSSSSITEISNSGGAQQPVQWHTIRQVYASKYDTVTRDLNSLGLIAKSMVVSNCQ
jgi:hypothetical protein